MAVRDMASVASAHGWPATPAYDLRPGVKYGAVSVPRPGAVGSAGWHPLTAIFVRAIARKRQATGFLPRNAVAPLALAPCLSGVVLAEAFDAGWRWRLAGAGAEAALGRPLHRRAVAATVGPAMQAQLETAFDRVARTAVVELARIELLDPADPLVRFERVLVPVANCGEAGPLVLGYLQAVGPVPRLLAESVARATVQRQTETVVITAGL